MLTGRSPVLSSNAAVAWRPGAQLSAEAVIDPGGWFQRARRAEQHIRPRVVHLPADRLSVAERSDIAVLRGGRAPTQTPPTWSVMVKAGSHVVAHADIGYRVIQIGQARMPVGAISQVAIGEAYRGRGYGRSILASTVSFVGVWLWAPFAVVICPRADASFYTHLGWSIRDTSAPPGDLSNSADLVVVSIRCQDAAAWPTGALDLGGPPW
jgi:GNAT superfamily N-acetyltransferase